MKIKPIKNDFDHRQALIEIEKLLDSRPGSADFDRMEVLVTLVEAYEASHYPIPTPDDPAAVLEYYIESRGIGK
jgi:HTH-type transcriptional regulator/antitoxin HigA